MQSLQSQPISRVGPFAHKLHEHALVIAPTGSCSEFRKYRPQRANLCFTGIYMHLADAVNVSVPEEMDGKLTKSIIEEYGLKSSASMVRPARVQLCPKRDSTNDVAMQGLSKKHDISSEDNEVVKAGKEHLIKCLEASLCIAHASITSIYAC